MTLSIVSIVISIFSTAIATGAFINSYVIGRRNSQSVLAFGVAQNVQIGVDNATRMVIIYNNSAEAITVHMVVCGGEVMRPPRGNLAANTSMELPLPPGGEPLRLHLTSVTFEDCRRWMWERVGRQQPTRVPNS